MTKKKRPYGDNIGRSGKYKVNEYYFRIMPDGSRDGPYYRAKATIAHSALDSMIANCACCIPVKWEEHL